MVASLLLPLLIGRQASAGLDAAGLAARAVALGEPNVVVALADGEPVGDASAKSLDALKTSLKGEDVRYYPAVAGAASAIYSQHLPYAWLYSLARYRKPGPVAKLKLTDMPEDALVGGKLTYASKPGESLRLSSLAKLKWTLPLTLSSAFNEEVNPGLALAASVKDLDEAGFLRGVARAIGARFRQTSKAYLLEPLGAELKSRAIRAIELVGRDPVTPGDPRTVLRLEGEGSEDSSDGLNLLVAGEQTTTLAYDSAAGQRQDGRGSREPKPPTDAIVLARLTFARAVVDAIGPDAFEGLLSGDLASVSLPLGGNPALSNGVLGILRAEASAPTGPGPQPQGASQIAEERLRRLLATVSAQNPGGVTVGKGLAIGATLNLVDRRGRIVRTQTVKGL